MQNIEIIKAENISKSFRNHKVLDHFNCSIKKEEFILIQGASGSGKSTLLNIFGLLDKPDEGHLYLYNDEIKPFSKSSMQLLRKEIGYLFQNFALMEDETVNDNLYVALAYSNKTEKDIPSVLDMVGLDQNIRTKNVRECSGGEQQRIAMARLLLKPCSIVLADEPTGSLDIENRDKIIELLKMLKEHGKTIIVASHDLIFEEVADRIIKL